MAWFTEQVLRILFMSLVVTGVATWRNLGFVEDFFARWLYAWEASIVISLPLGIVIGRIVHKIVQRLFTNNSLALFWRALINSLRIPHA